MEIIWVILDLGVNCSGRGTGKALEEPFWDSELEPTPSESTLLLPPRDLSPSSSFRRRIYRFWEQLLIRRELFDLSILPLEGEGEIFGARGNLISASERSPVKNIHTHPVKQIFLPDGRRRDFIKNETRFP